MQNKINKIKTLSYKGSNYIIQITRKSWKDSIFNFQQNMQNPSPEHQKLVAALIDHFRTKLGYTILSAAHPNFNAPEKHGRHEPDIVARDSNGVLHIAEAKASYDDIFSETAKEQFLDFSNRVMTGTNTPVPFHIVVYKEDEPALINRLNQLGLGRLIGTRILTWTL